MANHKKRVTKVCEHCHKNFETGGRAGRSKQRFCSRRCSAILKNKHGILGRKFNNGYTYIADSKHPHANRGYVAEHRLVAEKMLGRTLTPRDQIHHLDGNKANNDPRNLLILDRASHRQLHEYMSSEYQREHFGTMQEEYTAT